MKDFNSMSDIYNSVTNFDAEEFTTISAEMMEQMNKDEENKRCDTKMQIVSKVVAEMNKHESFKNKLRNLQRLKLGILDFNMVDANEKVSHKLEEFNQKLKESIREYKDQLEL